MAKIIQERPHLQDEVPGGSGSTDDGIDVRSHDDGGHGAGPGTPAAGGGCGGGIRRAEVAPDPRWRRHLLARRRVRNGWPGLVPGAGRLRHRRCGAAAGAEAAPAGGRTRGGGGRVQEGDEVASMPTVLRGEHGEPRVEAGLVPHQPAYAS